MWTIVILGAILMSGTAITINQNSQLNAQIAALEARATPRTASSSGVTTPCVTGNEEGSGREPLRLAERGAAEESTHP